MLLLFKFLSLLSIFAFTLAFSKHEDDKRFLRALNLDTSNKMMQQCLEKHQYPIWRRVMHDQTCKSAVAHMDEDLKVFGAEFAALARDKSTGFRPALLYLGEFLHSSKTDVCHLLTNNLLSCFYTFARPFISMLHDHESCSDFDFIDPDYTDEDFIHLAQTFTRLLCDIPDADQPSCLAQTVDALLNTTTGGNRLTLSLGQVFLQCQSKLGCCGGHLKEFGTALRKWKLGPFKWYYPTLAWLLEKAPCSSAEECRKPQGFLEYDPLLVDEDPIQDIRPEVPHFTASEPQQIHLAYAHQDENGYSNGMTIMFTTQVLDPEIGVRFGLQEDKLATKVVAASSTSYLDQLDSEILEEYKIIPNYHHVVTLSNLQPSSTYYYQCFNGASKSETSFFTTPASSAVTSGSFEAAIFGDMSLYESSATVDRLRKVMQMNAVDFAVHIGDIGYADNWYLHNLLTFGYENVWNDFMNIVQTITTTKPYMVLPGNHEAECHSPLVCMKNDILKQTFANYTAYNARFHMPSSASKGVRNMWYSFNHESVHFVAINTESDFPGSPLNNVTGINAGEFGDQLSWLEKDLELAARNRKQRPWIVVLGHRPIFEAQNRKITSVHLQAWLEPLFEKYKVDLYIAGHKHSYQRFTPIYDDKAELNAESSRTEYVNPAHTTYIIHGASGNEEIHDHESDPSEFPDYVQVADFKNYGVGVLKVKGRNELKWEFLHSESGVVLDAFTIRRRRRSF